MLVLGVDPGTAITGYGLVREDDGELTLAACGVITTSADLPLAERLAIIYRRLSELIAEHRPQAVAVEQLFFSRNVRTALAVGQARGVALLAAAHAGLPVAEYTPLQVKQAVVGYGQADKAQVQEMVRVVLRLDAVPQPDDAADAVAVAVCHLHSARWFDVLAARGG
ncbi:MAG: crossover junction endodeoxyribonuclease RuvC [Anaerolineae bacterium]|nr:crossover junction endodeoxyribonuclease RuvC [Anaerolineae bacterium]